MAPAATRPMSVRVTSNETRSFSLAANVREMAEQQRLALSLFDQGEYGLCEVCGKPIGKGRLQVFPRATLCVACKQREERR